MKLKTIILSFTLLTILTALAGLFMYYHSMKTLALNEDKIVSEIHIKNINSSISQLISRYNKIVLTLSRHEEIALSLKDDSETNRVQANQMLDLFNSSLETSVCYILNKDGIAIASSNRNDNDSFLGNDYSFRPYFKESLKGNSSVYLAYGVTSGQRGIYFSKPVYTHDSGSIIGVAVIKEAVDKIENNIFFMHYPTHVAHDDIIVISNEDGAVFISDREDLLFTTIWQVDENKIKHIAASKQFGQGPWPWAGFKKITKEKVIDQSGRNYNLLLSPIKDIPGWEIIHFSDSDAISGRIHTTIFKAAGYVFTLIFTIIGFVLVVLNFLANKAEKKLRESEDRYRSVTEAINEGIILQAQSGEILTWNKGAEKLFGILAKDVIGQTSDGKDWLTIHEDGSKLDGKDHPSMRTLRTGKACINEIMGIYQPSGDLRWISVNTNPLLRENDEKPYAVVISFSDITKHKQMEKALQESEAFLNQTGDMAKVGGWQLDLETQKVTWTQTTGRIHELPDGFVPALDEAINFYHPDDREAVTESVNQAIEAGKSYEFEARLITANGKQRWVRALGQPTMKAGKCVRLSGTFQDITDRKQAEEAVKRSESMQSKMVTNIGDVIVIVDKDGINRYKSTNIEKIFGWKPEDLVGESTWENIHPDDLEAMQKFFGKLIIEPDSIGTMECRYRCKDGSYSWIEFTGANLLHDPSINGILGNYHDITKRKQAENKLQQNVSLLNATQKLAKTGGFEVDLEKKVTFWTDEVYRIHDLQPERFKSIDEAIKLSVECYDPEDREVIIEAYKKCTEDGQAYDLKFPLTTAKGRRIWIRTETNPIMKDGKVIKVVGSFMDITERKQLEEQLRQTHKMESIGTLAGGIAHDFNNILSPIVGHTEMLIEDVSKDSPFQDSLNEIYTSSLRARDLVKQILTFSRQENSELKLVKVQPIIKEALNLIRSTIPTTIEIKQDIQTESGLIKADPTQIHQIIMNLSTNASHAMEKSGGELHISLKDIKLNEYDLINPDMKPGDYSCLTVGDTGIGMLQDVREKIFDPFFTTKERGKGTGMGLSVVHGIVNRMGGAIQVYSKQSVGTEFNIYFPIEKKFTGKQIFKKTNEILKHGTEHILLVDDEEGIVTMEKQMLERLGYRVTSHISSTKALEAFRDNPDMFDLVITDMTMPNITGDKLSAEIIKICPDIPILLCTGFSENISEERAASLGIKGFLMKPTVMKDFSQKINEVLEKK